MVASSAIVTVAEAPGARLPSRAKYWPVTTAAVPWLGRGRDEVQAARRTGRSRSRRSPSSSPRLVTVAVNVTTWPLGTTCGVHARFIATATDGATVRISVPDCSPGFGSYSFPSTRAARSSGLPEAAGVGSTTIVIVAEPPEAIVTQVGREGAGDERGARPWLADAETSWTPAGSGIVATTPVAVRGARVRDLHRVGPGDLRDRRHRARHDGDAQVGRPRSTPATTTVALFDGSGS